VSAERRCGRDQQRVEFGLIEEVDLLIVIFGRCRFVDRTARVAVTPALRDRELEDAVEVHVEVPHRLHRERPKASIEPSVLVEAGVNEVLVTKLGVRVLGTGLGAQPEPQPNWWAHHSACAWTAAWLTVRGRRFLAEPEIRHSGEWGDRLQWFEGYGLRRSGHRPDLIAWASNGNVCAIEVELARKSKARLNAILSLHNDWMLHGKVRVLLYIVGDQDAARRIRLGMQRNLFLGEGRVRIELLDTIKQETVEGFEARRPKAVQAVLDGVQTQATPIVRLDG
jgi:hypothetical protein